jgi:hypothetical protein
MNRSRAIQLASVAFENARLLFNVSRRDELLLSIYSRVMRDKSS